LGYIFDIWCYRKKGIRSPFQYPIDIFHDKCKIVIFFSASHIIFSDRTYIRNNNITIARKDVAQETVYLDPVIPVIIYHGKAEWGEKKNVFISFS